MIHGTIVQGMGGIYTARDPDGNEYVLRAKKKFRRLHMTPLVGDEILLSRGEISDEHGWIEEILPRKSICFRPPVANVTLMALVIAPEPAPDWLLIDKLLIVARREKLRTLLIVNKEDKSSNIPALARKQYQAARTPVYAVSAQSGSGLDELGNTLRGETVCFSGQSGVGKSTLLNALLHLHVETGEISHKILRGKNTTRHTELYEANGFHILDTPGFSLLTLNDAPQDPILLKDEYPEFEPYEGLCRFQPCYHSTEPGCAVLQAASQGDIDPDRLERYHLLLKDAKQAWRERYD